MEGTEGDRYSEGVSEGEIEIEREGERGMTKVSLPY